MKTLAKVGAAVFGLILLYLILTNAEPFNKVLTTTGSFLLKGTALLQGRPNADLMVTGV